MPLFRRVLHNPTAGVVHSDNVGSLASSSVVNSDVAANAAIDGTKVSPAFGNQTVSASGLSLVFNAPASLRSSGNDKDLCAFTNDVYDVEALLIGTDIDNTVAKTFGDVYITPSRSIRMQSASTTGLFVESSLVKVRGPSNFEVQGAIGDDPANFGGGSGVFHLGNATTSPTTAPTSGIILYGASGKLHVLQADGTNVTVGTLGGASFPAAGSLTTGNVLQVSGSSALSYGPVNLAGGANYVSGVLPAANQAVQSIGGDCSGTTAALTVSKVNGASVPASGSLTAGNVLQVSGASALSYGALNLAGGANYVSGVLPVGNQASQTMGGDVSGTTASAAVVGLQGRSVSNAAPNSGDLMMWGGSSWAPSSNGGLWQTAVDIDFTTLSLSTASGNGAFTVNGQTWTVQNFANASVVSVGGAAGLRIKANTNTSTSTPSSRTCPCISTPALSTLTGFSDPRCAIRASVWVKSENLTHNNEALDLFIDTQSNNQRHEYARYFKTTQRSDWMRLILNNVTKTSSDITTIISGHDCLQIELSWLGTDQTLLRSGQYSSGWPTAWSTRGVCGAAAGTWVNALMTDLSLAYVTLGVETGTNTNGTLDVSFGRLLIEYRRT